MTNPTPSKTPTVLLQSISPLLMTLLFYRLNNSHNKLFTNKITYIFLKQPIAQLLLLSDYNRNFAMNNKQTSSTIPPKRQLTPKVTLTKTTIVKSTPFLISRHHLDDTEMKQALRYEPTEATCRIPRSYSYKGERMTYQHSKIVPTSSQVISREPQAQAGRQDYYAELGEKKGYRVKQEQGKKLEDQIVMPYFRGGTRQQRSNSHYNQPPAPLIQEKAHLQERTHYQERPQPVQAMSQNEEYGLKEMHKARKKLEKEARKLRKLCKQRVERDIAEAENKSVVRLEEEVRDLKIRALEMQKNKLVQDLDQNMKKVEPAPTQEEPREKMRYNLNFLVLNKPRYKPKMTRGKDTDSSFSSFQLV